MGPDAAPPANLRKMVLALGGFVSRRWAANHDPLRPPPPASLAIAAACGRDGAPAEPFERVALRCSERG